MKSLVKKVAGRLRHEPVFVVSAVLALVSMCVIPPCAAYASYVDWPMLAKLLSFMICVVGLSSAGVFERLARLILSGRRSTAFTIAALVGMPFVVSMFVTNDVALLTFVPLALEVLSLAARPRLMAPVMVLQTIAANMGSMLMPFGNPQNLYLFEHYSTPIGAFLGVTAPITAVNGLALALCVAVLGVRGRNQVFTLTASRDRTAVSRLDAALFAAAFLLCVAGVLNIIPEWSCLVVCVVVVLVRNPRLFGRVDWFLLGTFLCFFIFSGNLAAIEPVRETLTSAMAAHPFWIALASCQVISNVPAALLLAPFTTDWQSMLLAVDIGGLGTPVASLASLISLGLYTRAHIPEAAGTGGYLARFLLANAAFLVLSCACWLVLYQL